MRFPYEEFDLTGISTYPLRSRDSKAKAADFARPYVKGSGLAAFLRGLPRLLAAADFKAVVEAIRSAQVRRERALSGASART